MQILERERIDNVGSIEPIYNISLLQYAYDADCFRGICLCRRDVYEAV